ncbi:MAG TPA: hypothetical protein VNZ23_05145, partial [Xanthobacteraceae bacterium]|nr:hypothetical protein [Xanthobacteraceae bacterium]
GCVSAAGALGDASDVAFVLWAVIADNPFGGEPMAVVQIAPPGPTAPRVIGGPATHGAPAMVAPNASGPAESGPGHHDGPPDGPVTIPGAVRASCATRAGRGR